MTALTTIRKSTMVGATAIVTIKNNDDPFCLHPYKTFALSAGGPVSDSETFVSEAAALQAHGRLIEQVRNEGEAR